MEIRFVFSLLLSPASPLYLFPKYNNSFQLTSASVTAVGFLCFFWSAAES